MASLKEVPPRIHSREGITETAFGFQAARVLLTAFELGIFTALGKGLRTAEQVAVSLGTQPAATQRLMNALCAMELLGKKGDRYHNTGVSERYLVEGSPEYMAGLIHISHLWDSWTTLTDTVRSGKGPSAQPVSLKDDKWVEAFIAAMHERACAHAPSVVSLLDLSSVSRVMDVGGGSGAYAMAFVRANSNIKATVFDLPNVIPLTMEYIRMEGLKDKIDTVAGDYHVDDLGEGFDLVFVSAVIHSNSSEQNLSLIRKCSKALSAGGQLVIQDFIMNEDRTSPAFGALFSLNMLVGTEAGDTYTESEVFGWMKEGGMTDIHRKDTEFGTTLMIGRKVGL